jgi:hypothetical protein
LFLEPVSGKVDVEAAGLEGLDAADCDERAAETEVYPNDKKTDDSADGLTAAQAAEEAVGLAVAAAVDLAVAAAAEPTACGYVDQTAKHSLTPVADCTSDGKVDHVVDHGVDHGVDHAVDHVVDHGVDHGADHGVDHTVDHAVDHGVDQASDHVVDHAADHTADRSVDDTDAQLDRSVGPTYNLTADRYIDSTAELSAGEAAVNQIPSMAEHEDGVDQKIGQTVNPDAHQVVEQSQAVDQTGDRTDARIYHPTVDQHAVDQHAGTDGETESEVETRSDNLTAGPDFESSGGDDTSCCR